MKREAGGNEIKVPKYSKSVSKFVSFSFFSERKQEGKGQKKQDEGTPRGGGEEGKRESIKIWFQESESCDTLGGCVLYTTGFTLQLDYRT